MSMSAFGSLNNIDLLAHTHPTYTSLKMVTVTISAAGKAPAVAQGLPLTLEIPRKSIDEVTVGDVKSSLSAKFPKVRSGS
jgi:hypothetical protein